MYFGIGMHIHASDLSLSQHFCCILATIMYLRYLWYRFRPFGPKLFILQINFEKKTIRRNMSEFYLQQKCQADFYKNRECSFSRTSCVQAFWIPRLKRSCAAAPSNKIPRYACAARHDTHIIWSMECLLHGPYNMVIPHVAYLCPYDKNSQNVWVKKTSKAKHFGRIFASSSHAADKKNRTKSFSLKR